GGCAIALVVGLGVVPAVVFGPGRAVDYNREWFDVVLRPGLTRQSDPSRARELLDVAATDSPSPVATMHNTLNFDRATRPRQAAPAVRRAHWLIGALLTGLTLLAAGRRRRDGPATVVLLGALLVLMLLLSPVCHLHYFCLWLPLVMG